MDGLIVVVTFFAVGIAFMLYMLFNFHRELRGHGRTDTLSRTSLLKRWFRYGTRK